MGRVVHEQLRLTTVATAANTLQAAPQTTSWNLGNVKLLTLTILVPPGHSGLTGIHVDYQGVALVPFGQPPAFLQADDEVISIPVGIEVGAALSVVTYNADPQFGHGHYLRALVDVWLDNPAEAGAVPDLLVIG